MAIQQKQFKLYKVFSVDICFEQYAADTVLIGADSVQDLLDHFKEIFPDTEHVIDEYDFEDRDNTHCYYGEGLKIGDVYVEPYFTDEQLEEFKDTNEMTRRISVIPDLYTTKPYTQLTGFGYME